MAKVITIYLSGEEVKALEKFCDKNNCSQYATLKTALKELLYKPAEAQENKEQKTPTKRTIIIGGKEYIDDLF